MPPFAFSRPVLMALAVYVGPLAAVAPDVERKIRPAIRRIDAGAATAMARACRISDLLLMGEVGQASIETDRTARKFRKDLQEVGLQRSTARSAASTASSGVSTRVIAS